jgi:hypothetical protein
VNRAVIALALVVSVCLISPVAAQAAQGRTVRLGRAAVIGVVDSGSKKPNPLADPTADTAPSRGFVNACFGMTTSKADNDTCDDAARKDFDAVRKREGLGPMVLPAGFDRLSVPSQLLGITDLERVDRGLRAVRGRSSAIDKLAHTGATKDTDPMFPNPCHCNSAGANWAAAGNSALLDDFFWMYDDGLGSGNEDCKVGDTSGCWGHRHVIIGHYDAPVVMGAAVATGTAHGTSMTEEFLGGDSTDAVNVPPTWATVAATMPVGLSASAVNVDADTAKTAHATVIVRAYTAGPLAASITTGRTSWTVRPAHCSPVAGHTCTLHLRFDPGSSGRHAGQLTVSGPNRDRTVKLVGTEAAPRLAPSVSRARVARGRPVTLTVTARSGLARAPLAHLAVQLQRKVGRHWRGVGGARHTSAHGRARFAIHPRASATYRVEAFGRDGTVEGVSPRQRVTVG